MLGRAGGARTRLFRAIGEHELDDLLRFGDYGLSRSGGGKYFALSEQGAVDFANTSINTGRRMTVTGTDVPSSFLDRGFRFFDPGGGGSSIHFEDNVLFDLYEVMSLPEILHASWVPVIRR
ncbi:MAG TPA: hypothetical protein VKN18_21595 [Blastocatellia bacterium]|nr:hypothetical protein [Blastocatellia bacterium]